MEIANKSIKVILSMISLYIILEEYAVIMQTSSKNSTRILSQGNLWGIYGRNRIMQMRELVNLKFFVR